MNKKICARNVARVSGMKTNEMRDKTVSICRLVYFSKMENEMFTHITPKVYELTKAETKSF